MTKARITRMLDDAPHVCDVVSLSSSLCECAKNQRKARDLPKVWYTAGVHPQQAAAILAAHGIDAVRAAVSEHVLDPKCVAIGECGLNYNRGHNEADIAAQKLVFETLVDVAIHLHMPLFLHCRDAFADFLEVLQRKAAAHGGTLPCGGVVNCFTGTAEQAQAFVALGLYIAVSGWLFDASRNADLLAAMPDIPMRCLVPGTDTPWLPCRAGEQHSAPRDVGLIAERVAEIKQLDMVECKFAMYFNVLALFPKILAAKWAYAK